MKRIFCHILAILLVLAVPLTAAAQGKTGDLVGYEKAEYVSGFFSLNARGNSVMLNRFQTVYDKPLEVYVTRGFQQGNAFKVGEIASDKRGDIFFEIPALDIQAYDSVLLMVPGWSVPVGVGLLE